MVSVGVSRMGNTGIVFVEPGAKVNSEYYCQVVNMFSVAVYYLPSVQDASATPGPCSRTAHRHTLLGTPRRTCGVRTSRSSSLTCGPQTARAWIQSITLFGGALQQRVYQRRRFTTINQIKQAIVNEWGKLSQRFIDRSPLVSGVAGLSASSSSKADTVNIWCKNCMMWQLF